MNIILGIPFIMGLFVPLAWSKPFPAITDKAYTARIQIVIVDKGKSMTVLEKFDETEKKSSLTVFTGERAHTTLMDYNKRAVIDVSYDVSTQKADKCGVLSMPHNDDMDSTGLKSLFILYGGWHNRSSHTVPHLFSTKRVFTPNNNDELTYLGLKLIDEDIEVDCWKSTMKLGKGSFDVWFYFTPTKWAPAEDSEHTKILPLRIEVKGVKDTNSGTKIHHYYEYLDFESHKRLPSDAFDMPKGAVCVSGNPNPDITYTMTYSREIVDSQGDVSIADVTYSKQLGLLKIAAPKWKVLYDFNSGVRLELNNDNKCVVRAIDPDLDSNSQSDGNYVKDIGPFEFWLINTTQYAEDGHSRTIGAKIFNNYDGHKKDLIVYYGTKNWNFMNDGYKPPLSMDRGYNHYNFFNFKNTAPIAKFVDDYCDYGADHQFIALWFQFDSRISKEEMLTVRNMGIMYNAIAHFSEVSVYQVGLFKQGFEVNVQSRTLHFSLILDGPPSPHNLYRQKKNRQVAANNLKQKSKTMKQDDYDVIIKKSAEICENTTSEAFMCRNYDLCRNDDNSFTMKMYSTLPSHVSIVSSSTCDHFSRSVNGKPLISSRSAISKLKDAIKKGSLRFSIPDKWGNITFIAYTPVGENINHYKEHVSIIDSKFAYVRDYSITETEVIENTDRDECRRMCYNRGSYCKGFRYCFGNNKCALSTNFPQKGSTPSAQSCATYKRLYVADFKLTTGLTMLPKSQNVYKNIPDVEVCARKCVENKEYSCESFNYCEGSKECSLSKNHVYSMTADRVSNVAPACKHYSNNYLTDFIRSEHTALSTDDKHSLETVIVSSPEQCAYICRSGTTGKGCVQFDYCSDKKMCRLGSFKTQGHTGYKASINCDTYTLTDAERVALSGRLAGENKVTTYSDASFGGLAIAMVLMGLVLGAGIIYILHRQRYLNMFIR